MYRPRRRANAVGITVECEPGVVLSFARRLSQRLHVRLDRFRINASEKWIAISADFAALDAVAAKKFAK